MSTISTSQATSHCQKLAQKVNRYCKETPHFQILVSPYRDFLDTFPIEPIKGPLIRSSRDSIADKTDPMAVLQAKTDLLPPSGEIFQPQYFRFQIYSVKLPYSVADFYGCRDIEESFLHEAEVFSGDLLMSNLLPHI